MAVQAHVAFSGTFSGAGVIAGGPYWTAQANSLLAIQAMSNPALVNVPLLRSQTAYAAGLFSIDNPSNLKVGRAMFSLAPLGPPCVTLSFPLVG